LRPVVSVSLSNDVDRLKGVWLATAQMPCLGIKVRRNRSLAEQRALLITGAIRQAIKLSNNATVDGWFFHGNNLGYQQTKLQNQ